MDKKKIPVCPVCHGQLLPVFAPSPEGMGRWAVGIVDNKGKPRMQVKCMQCGATMLRKPEDFYPDNDSPLTRPSYLS